MLVVREDLREMGERKRLGERGGLRRRRPGRGEARGGGWKRPEEEDGCKRKKFGRGGEGGEGSIYTLGGGLCIVANYEPRTANLELRAS